MSTANSDAQDHYGTPAPLETEEYLRGKQDLKEELIAEIMRHYSDLIHIRDHITDPGLRFKQGVYAEGVYTVVSYIRGDVTWKHLV
jgi:hypothetical protein